MFGSNLPRAVRKVNKVLRRVIKLENIKGIRVKGHGHKAGSTGARKFVKDFAPSIKYHNEGVKFENVKEWKTVPELSLDMADGTVETVDVTGVDQEGILNMVLEADKRGTAQTTASDKPETTTFFGKEIEL